MSYIYAKPDPLRSTSAQLEALSKRLKSISAEIEAISRQSYIRTSSYTSIQKSLATAISSSNTEADRIGVLASTIAEITALYEQTEKRLVNATSAEKAALQSDANKIRDMLIEIGGILGMDTAALFSDDPVNLSNGNYVYEKTFFHYDTPISVNFRIFYNVCGVVGGSLGKGWTHNFERRITIEERTARILGDDGSVKSFSLTDQETFAPVPGTIGELKRISSGYLYLDEERDAYYFDADGKMSAAVNMDGWRLDCKYEQDKLLEVTCTDGISLHFEYDSDNRLVKLTDQVGRCVKFQNTDGFMTQAEDMAGNITAYEYDKGRMFKVTAPTGDLSVQNEYDEQGRTIQQRFADGGIVTYRYDDTREVIVMRRQNGSEISYFHDRQFRNTRTVYPDGEERIEYNVNNQRVTFTDKLGRTSRYAYDGAGRLSSFVNAAADIMAFSYNDAGQVTELSLDGKIMGAATYDDRGHQTVFTNANGAECRFSYDDLGRVIAVIHEDGSCTSLIYDEQGNIICVQDPVTGSTKYQYDECRRVISTTDALGNETKYRYDAIDQLIQVINAEGLCRSYSYDARGNITQVTDFNGGVTEIKYNEMNRPASITDPDGNTTTFEYDKMTNVIRKIAADGGVTAYEYDSENRRTKIRHPMGGIETAEYDAVGNLIQRRAPDGGVYRFVYDALDRPISVADPVNGVRRAAYDKLGNVVSICYENGSKELFSYDNVGNQISHTTQDGYTKYFRYNALDKLVEIRDDEGVLVEFEYGAGGQLLQENHADGASLSYKYDEAGNVIQLDDSVRGTWCFQYNSLGRVVQVEHVGEGVETYEYDLAGNICAVTDGNGNRTVYQYSKAGALEKVIDANGVETGYVYDPCYRLLHILQPENGRLDASHVNEFNEQQHKIRTTSYEWDLEGNIRAIIDDAGNRVEYTHDPCGRVLSKLDQEGHLTCCTYRQDGLEDVLTFSDGRSVKYQYDELKHLAQIEDWLGITRMSRDAIGRIVDEEDHEGNHTGYKWNKRGSCTGISYPDGRTVTYEYNARQQLSRCVSDKTDVRYEYLQNGQLRERQLLDAIRIGYEYDQLGRVSALSRYHGEDMTARFTYSYDACARKTKITEWSEGKQEVEFRFSYDALGRLTAVKRDGVMDQSFEYDIFGNRTKMVRDGQATAYGYDSLDRMMWRRTAGEERKYNYDKRGNLVEESVNGVRRLALHFDSLDRLAKAVSDRGEAEYSYNGMAMLAHINFTENGHIRKEKLIYDYSSDQNHLLAMARDEQWEDYIWDKQPLFAASSQGLDYFLNDERMSNRSIFSIDGAKTFSYDVFGVKSQNDTMPAQFAYTGFSIDPITGYYNAGWRQYDASAGRFISKDPIAGSLLIPMTLNPFIYCLSDPINNVDPTGMILAWLAGGIVGTVVNVGAKFAGDVVNSVKNGKWTGSSWESYVGAAAGGFVRGSVFVVAGPTAAGAAGAATETFITNGLSMLAGEEGYRKEDGYNAGKLLWDTGVSTAKGAAAGFVFGKAGEAITKYVKIPGITTGRGSYAAVWKQVMTKAQRGIIANVTGKTLMKGLVSFGLVKTVDTIISKGIDALKDGAKDYVKTKAGEILDWLLNGGSSSDMPTGLRELLATNRSATCATA